MTNTSKEHTADGGPAFPRTGGEVPGPNTPEWVKPQDGMSLRDWFAGMAISRDLLEGIYVDGEGMKTIAANAYRMADAMLAARKANEG